jgi:hypothetical protein
MVPTACMNDAAGARGVGKRGNSGGVVKKALHAKMKNNSDCPPEKLIFATLASRALVLARSRSRSQQLRLVSSPPRAQFFTWSCSNNHYLLAVANKLDKAVTIPSGEPLIVWGQVFTIDARQAIPKVQWCESMHGWRLRPPFQESS